MSIVVTTPTGNIGSRIVERLLEANADLTLLARDAARLPAGVADRARIVEGSLEDPAALTEATRGASALFLLTPPHLTTTDWRAFQLRIGHAAADAVSANNVQRVVFLSSSGAQRDDLFAVSRLGEVERLLMAVAPNVLSLRAGFFLENFLSAAPTIATDGAVYMTLPADRSLAMVSTHDIGDVAADMLLDRTWTGHLVRGVHGAADVTPTDVVRAAAAAIGRPVRYVQVPDEAMRDALLAMGASAHVAEEYPKLMRGLSTLDHVAERRTADTTTPTTIDDWARQVLAPTVEAATPARA